MQEQNFAGLVVPYLSKSFLDFQNSVQALTIVTGCFSVQLTTSCQIEDDQKKKLVELAVT